MNKLQKPRKFQLPLLLLAGLWGGALLAGAAMWWRYLAVEGGVGVAASEWPLEEPGFGPRAGRAALVLVAHPHCPCTRASVAELERLLARGGADGLVVFVKPEGAAEGWERTALWDKAAGLPGVRVMADAEGTLAAKFGARTSGHAVFYDEAGLQRYSGGLTEVRGHEGLGSGGKTVLSLLLGRGNGQEPARAPVYGCPLSSNPGF